MLNKNKIIIFFLLIAVAFSLFFKQELLFAKTTTVVPENITKYWKNLNFSILLDSDLNAEITETHVIRFNQRLDKQSFQSLLHIINISNYIKLTDLKIFEKNKDGKLLEYSQEDLEKKENNKFYVVGPDAEQKLFSVRIFFDAKNEEKTFIIKYKLLEPRYPNFVEFYNDYDNIIIYPIPTSSDIFIQDLTLDVSLPLGTTENDFYFWGLPKGSDYKISIFSNKINLSGATDKTNTFIGFNLLTKVNVFKKPENITRKNLSVLQSKIAEYKEQITPEENNKNLIKYISTFFGLLISLISLIYLIKVYLDIKLKRISKKGKTFEDVDVLKYKNFKAYFSGMILRKKVNRNDLISIFVDLSIRGYMSLRISRTKKLDGKIVDLFILDKNLEKVENDILSNTERHLLNYLFKKSNSIYLDSLKDSYRSRPSYFYSSIGSETLSYRFFIIPFFIHNISLYRFLLKILFILLSILSLLLPLNLIYLFFIPLFFVFFTDFLIMESAYGLKIKRNLIAFQNFCLNWNQKIDETFVDRIPFFISLSCLSNVLPVVSKEKTLRDLNIEWLIIETGDTLIEDKNIDIVKNAGETSINSNIATWNDLSLFIEKIKKTFGK
jgi:hypothetical protein